VHFGNPSLDTEGAADLRSIIVETGALTQIEQMIRVCTDAALVALAQAPLDPSVREALTELAGAAVDRTL